VVAPSASFNVERLTPVISENMRIQHVNIEGGESQQGPILKKSRQLLGRQKVARGMTREATTIISEKSAASDTASFSWHSMRGNSKRGKLFAPL